MTPFKGKTWPRDFLHSLTSFDVGQLTVVSGVRIGLFVITPLVTGLFLNRIPEAIFATLGTMTVSMVEGQRPEWATNNILILVCVIYASGFAVGIVVSTTGFLVIPLYALGLFIISYAGVYPRVVNISSVCSIVFSIGIGLPGPSISVAGEGFLLYFVGGLWALLGVVIPLLHSTSKPKPTTVSVPLHNPGFTYREKLTSLLNNLSVRSQPFRLSVAFSIIGAIGLLIAVDLGLTKASWVLITICVLFLRSEISTTFSFSIMRIIGTIFGAAIGSVITTYVYNQSVLLLFLFLFASVYFAVRNINYAMTTLFLTPFILVLLNILSPGQTALAQARLLDTLIGVALALCGQLLLWTGSRWKRLA
jgi:Fusaric acid resistance protein-like